MTTPTQKAYVENVYRSIKYIQRELKLRQEDSNLIDLMNHLENNVDLLCYSLKTGDL